MSRESLNEQAHRLSTSFKWLAARLNLTQWGVEIYCGIAGGEGALKDSVVTNDVSNPHIHRKKKRSSEYRPSGMLQILI